ncbi:MAG: fused MFS/spermidine synthase [Candidatus Methylomirabilales bacterium]
MEKGAGIGFDAERETKQIIAAVCVCFLFSGTTGLIYEVLWTRMLGLVFGHTVFAITTVLAAFMAGLALGSYLFGGMADRYRHPLLLYGFLEAGIGIYALLTPGLFSWAEGIYIGLHRSLGLSFFSFSLAQFLLLFVILLVPTTLMGATLPVLTRFFVHEIAALGRLVARLYALNTFGAVLGAYAAGFHLIPTFGVRATLLLAATANLGIGALAVVFDRHLEKLQLQAVLPGPRSPVPSLQGPAPTMPREEGGVGWGVWLSVAGLGISGAASMMYEVAWTRALVLVIGSSTYAFSTMLVTFLAGLALGSYLFSRLAGRLKVNPFLFGGLQLGIGAGALVVIPFFDRIPEMFLWAFRVSQSSGFIKVLQFSISALAMFLPTLFMGATFPCVAQIASRKLSRVGHDVGRIYFVNTVGAIAGTILTGFLLIPTWGLQSTLKLAVSLNLGLALVLFMVSRGATWRRQAAVVPLLALALLFVSRPWNTRAMTSGVAIYGKGYFSMLGKVDFREAVSSSDRLLFYKDGISTTVSVHREAERLYLRVNGKTDASNTQDMHTQLLLGHLPVLFHPDAKRALVIGLGSGVTAGAVALHPVEQVDVIEIEPAVVRAAAFFAKENRDVLRNPRARVTIADGRNFLLASGRPYDVIISEPSNPWMRGIGNLFSLEFYELVARRLAPNGVVCQWIHAYNLFPHDLKMVVKTFRSAFPHTTIWNTTLGDLVLIGGKDPLSLDYARLQSRYDSLPGLREDLARLGVHSPLGLLADFVLSEEDTAQYAEYASLNTDDLPLLEFSAPESLYADTLELNGRVMKSFKTREFPPIRSLPEDILGSAAFRRELGLALWTKEMPDAALIHLDEAVRVDPRDARSLLLRGRVHVRLNSVLKAEADFKAALRMNPAMGEAHEALAQLYQAQKMSELAEAHLRKSVALRPKDPRYLAELADLYRDEQRFDQAITCYLAAISIAPQNARLWTGLGLAYRGAGSSDEALEAFRQVLLREPENAFVHYQMGLTYLGEKRFDEAASALRMAALKDPAKPDPHIELGRLYNLRGEKTKALEAFRRALRLDPLNASILKAVEEISAAL